MNGLIRAAEPFYFYTKLNLDEPTGLKAKSIKELLYNIRNMPGAVIYYHTHHFFKQHHYLTPEPPNDFAYWVRQMLGHDSLGEQLASINIHEFTTIIEIKEKIVSILEKYLTKKERPRLATRGEEFCFIKSVSFIIPTSYKAYNLKEFKDCLKEVTVGALYFHIFEAKLRLEKEENDFSFWLSASLGEHELAKKIAKLDPYTHTMETLRKSIVNIIENRIKEVA